MMLIIVCGLPGSGKSALAQRIARKYSAVLLNTDVIRKRHLKRRTYTAREKEAVYNLMFDEALKALKSGRNTVLDGTFYKEALRSRALSLAKKAGSKPFIIECTLNEAVLKKRIEKRKRTKSVSEADWAVYKKIKRQFEPIRKKRLLIDNALPLSTRMKMVDEWIKRR